MKKRFFLPLACLTLGMGIATMTSCSSDESEGPIDPSSIQNPSSIITTDYGDKVLVTKIGNDHSFRYDENGMPISVDGYVIDYEKGIITPEGNSDWYAKFTMNKDGYITSLSFSSEESTGNIQYSYDKNGLLEKATANVKYTFNEGNYSQASEGWTSITYTYSDQKLIKGVWNGEYDVTIKEEGQTYKEKFIGSTVNTVTESVDNPLRQHSLSLEYFFDIEAFGPLSIVGLRGKAPANLPTKINHVEYDGDKVDCDVIYEYPITFNPDGTIREEDGYLYQYMPLGTRSTFPYVFETSENATRSHRHLFNFPKLRRANNHK